jgi:hypothetical protein
MQPGPPSPNISPYIYIWICMAYGNELVLEELVICCVAVGKKRLG